jgi:UDP-N-acetyl-D-glucosamine dehydrogenase
VKGARVAILGVAYKEGIGDTRESPALKILALLADRGADLVYHDPHVPELASGMRSVPLEEALDGCDLAVIVTAHPEVDLGEVVRRAPRVLDLRGVTRRAPVPSVERL